MKFKVSYVIDAGTTSVSEIQAYIEEELGGQDLEIVEITPQPEAGWYTRDDQGEFASARYLSHTDIREYVEDYSAYVFMSEFTRVKAPEPWVEEIVQGYKDGYYRMDDSHLYRRDAGVWTFYLQCSGDWVESSCSDSTIGRDFSVRYLGVDAP